MEFSKPSYSALASYAVIKTLTDSKNLKSSYEVLAEFIKYIIVDKKLYKFSLMDIDNLLKMEFGFDNIPLPAIKTSLKKIEGCKKAGDDYSFSNVMDFDREVFEKEKNLSSKQSENLVEKLIEFAKEKYGSKYKREDLERAFIKYLLDDSATVDQSYLDIISKFIISIEGDDALRNKIAEIREGSIIFCGLAYNISEVGSITSGLTLFLDTEVLFNIIGYNGELYKRVSEDFLKQVNAANVKKRRIKLRYFSEVKNEIKLFFTSAEKILNGHGELISATAMSSILNGCSTISDIRDKEADFFHILKTQYGIVEDENNSYYDEVDYKYNIESIPDGFPSDERSYEAIKFISHINVLRKGEQQKEYTKCGYLLITETRRIQEISNSMKGNNHVCGYALPISAITNILWFKLGFGFSKNLYPINTDVSYKARFILSGELASKISRLYYETKEQYKTGKISKEQVASRIVLMRDKSKNPDEITNEMIEEVFDFSPDYILRFEEGVKFNKVQNEEKKKIIDKLETRNKYSEMKNRELNNMLDATSKELGVYKNADTENKRIIGEQEEELKKLREEHDKHIYKVKKKEAMIKMAKRIASKVFLLFVSIAIIQMILLHVTVEWQNTFNLVACAVSTVIALVSIWQFDYKKYKDDMK